MTELLTKTLAQIVTNNHHAARVFEKYQLDFCCKGKRSLEQACQEKEIPTGNIVAELEEATASNSAVDTDFRKFSLAQLADYIVMTHHELVKKEMPAILGYLQKIASKHGDRHPEMVKVLQLFTAVKEEMDMHMQKEELVLFPRIRETERMVLNGHTVATQNSYLLSPIHLMEQEHDHAGTMLAEIGELTAGYTPPADACTTFRLCLAALKAFELDLHQHVHLENNILFPKAAQLYANTGSCSLN